MLGDLSKPLRSRGANRCTRNRQPDARFMTNVVALCVGFCGLSLFTQLLRSGSLGGPTYAALLTVLAVSCVAIAKIDLVEILDLKNMRLEVQKARDDVYAKVDELQKVAAGVASFTDGQHRVRKPPRRTRPP
jgi:hypothetical protein